MSLRWCVLTLNVSFALLVLVFTSRAAGATTAQSSWSWTLFAVPTHEQFVNNRDDRARGLGTNAYGNYRGTGVATTREHGVGPLPGDEGLYTFDLYRTAGLTRAAGSGVFVCEYNFQKVGSCDVSYHLSDGDIVGIGSFNALETGSFSLNVTGGTGAYRFMKGTVLVTKDVIGSSKGAKQEISHTVPVLVLEAQRLNFFVHPA